MKRYIAMGGLTLVSMAGAAGYMVSDTQGDSSFEPVAPKVVAPAPLADQVKPDKQVKKKKKAEPKVEAPAPAPTKEKRIEAKISQIEIGSSYTTVTEIMGAADWTEEQSTDFGYDVIYWYGAYGVYTSNAKVTHIDYFESEA